MHKNINLIVDLLSVVFVRASLTMFSFVKWLAIRSFANRYGATQDILPFPIRSSSQSVEWWVYLDLNQGPRRYQRRALTA